MSDNELLENVKNSLGITGDYLNATLKTYMDEVVEYMVGAGVKRDDITTGVVARGIADLWNYGSGEGRLSEYFYQRVSQLVYKAKGEE